MPRSPRSELINTQPIEYIESTPTAGSTSTDRVTYTYTPAYMTDGSHRTCDVWDGYVVMPRVMAEPTRQAEERILQAVANEQEQIRQRDFMAWMRENAFAVRRRTPTGGGRLYELYKETIKALDNEPDNKFNMEEVW